MNPKDIRQWYALVMRVREDNEDLSLQILNALNRAKFFNDTGGGHKAWRRLRQIKEAYL
jgi:hypothetical protein